MLTWPELTEERSDLTEAGRSLFYQFGVGLAFLATVRPDGGPRMHPVCPVITKQGIHALIIPSPKLHDLRRDDRYALHCFPPAENEDAFYLAGRAQFTDDAGVRDLVVHQFLAERRTQRADPGTDDWSLVEFLVQTCLLTRSSGHGDPAPVHTIWHAP